MKRCPECERTYHDNSLNFCLEDGATLLSGDSSEPVTAILPGEVPSSELPTRRHKQVTEDPRPSDTKDAKTKTAANGKNTLAIGAAIVALLVIGIVSVRYFNNRDSADIDSIAVIPFQNLSSNSDTDFLSDGISEALINSLTELQQLKVVARSTAFRYKGKDIDPKTIGRELHVKSVLTGSVRQSGDALDIQVDLVDTGTGRQLWGHDYESSISEVVAIKQAIAQEVTDKLRLRLTGDQQSRLSRSDTINPEAYQSYLRGRYFWNKRTPDSLNKAIEQFQNAINLDHNYALGYVGLADSYMISEEISGASPNETLPKARAAVDNALRIDDSIAEAHTSSASVYEAMWQWTNAEAEYRRAISLNPNYPTAHHWFSIFLRKRAQIDESWNEITEAQRLDPLSPVIAQNVSELLILKNDLEGSIDKNKSIIALDPSFPGAWDELGWAYQKQNRKDDAIAAFQKAVDLSGRTSRYLGDLGYSYGSNGKRAEAIAIAKELESRFEKGQSRGIFVASVYSGLDDRDQTFAWLKKDLELRCGIRLPYARWWFSFDDLHTDPHFADLIRAMGL